MDLESNQHHLFPSSSFLSFTFSSFSKLNFQQSSSKFIRLSQSHPPSGFPHRPSQLVDVNMPEIELGAHTLRSHGVQVARIHLRDWLILFLLAAIDVGLNVIEPFHRFVGRGMMDDLMYPLQGNTVPFWAVPFIAALLPFSVILIYYFIRRDVYDFHQATLGLLFSVLITAVMTDSIKDAVGRPRPDFFWRCFPDGKAYFDTGAGNVICTGIKSVIKEGYKSFPSGHTSWSFAGLSFLALYISGKVRAFDRRGHIAKLCLVFTPILVAALVGVSRVDDYWHHWQDVFAGSLLGSVVAAFCYLQFFPPPYDEDGWGPHAYFQMLVESQHEAQDANSRSLTTQLTTPRVRSQTTEEAIEMASARHIPRDSSSVLDGIESGRRW